MITEEWQKFRGWSVLEFFLKNDREVYVKELSRELKISPHTANYYLKFYKNAGILTERKKGNLTLYTLSDNSLVRELKRFYIIDQIISAAPRLCANKAISVALYGSCASGTYDKSSDIDMLVISQSKDINLNMLKSIEEKTGKEVKVEVLRLGEWRRLKRKKDKFAKSIISNHVLLCGAEI